MNWKSQVSLTRQGLEARKTAHITVAGLLATTSLLYSSMALAAPVVWTNATTGTLNGIGVTVTYSVSAGNFFSANLSGTNFSYAPLGASQQSINYIADNNLTITFASPINNLLFYPVFFRGSQCGGSGNYTFSATPTKQSGLASATLSGNVLAAGTSTYASGILSFSGAISTLTITSNCTGGGGQVFTLGTPPPPPPPTAPTNLTATVASPTQIDLTWADNSNNETGFKILGFPSGTVIFTTAANATGYSHTGLTCNTMYSYEVKATNASVDSTGVLYYDVQTAPCTYVVTVASSGTGTGTFTGNGSFAAGATVTLTATPTNGSTFTGWSPSPCAASFTMPANALTCTATFDAPVAIAHYHITVQTAGTGTGNVTGEGAYTTEDTVTLTATPTNGSSFTGWSPSPCAASFTMPANDLTCTAQFEPAAVTPPVVVTPPTTDTPAVTPTPVTPTPVTPTPVTPALPENLSLFVQVDGSGRGKVTSDTGLLCQSSDCQVDNNSGALKCNPEACSQVIKTLTTVNLKPVAEAGSVFSSWGGHEECIDGQVVMTGGRLCVAYFRKQQASLFLTMEGTGQGQVSVDVGKLDWTSNHEAHTSYNVGTEVGLTATALPGSYLVGWGGDEDCVDGKVAMKAERACVAHFNLNEESTHTVATEANPTLLPESSPPVTTTPEVPVETTPAVETTPITVEAVPAEVAAQAVVLPPVTLTTGKLGPGNLRSDPTGIDCGETCQAAYPIDTVVTLIATPNEGAMFKEWSGDCNSPELTTTVTVTTDSHCEAMFAEVATTTETTTVPEVIPPPVTTPAVPVTTTVPVMTPVATPVTPAPVPVVIPAPVIPIQPPILGGASFSCDTTGSINLVCNYGGRPVTQLNIQTWGMVSNGVLSNNLVNIGWVSNFTITANGKLTGGVVTGYIKNFGVMLNFDFKGMSIIGGTLGGVITNTSKVGGFFQDVTLLAGTKITGGTLKGTIKGDKKSPAVLEKVRIKKGSKLSGVKLGKDVKMEKGVVME